MFPPSATAFVSPAPTALLPDRAQIRPAVRTALDRVNHAPERI